MGKPITIYTVSAFDDYDNGTEFLVVGSYRRRGRALDECVSHIIQRINTNPAVACAAANDEFHPKAAMFLDEVKDGGDYAIPDPIAFRHYLRDELGGNCYYICSDGRKFYFNIDENDLVD